MRIGPVSGQGPGRRLGLRPALAARQRIRKELRGSCSGTRKEHRRGRCAADDRPVIGQPVPLQLPRYFSGRVRATLSARVCYDRAMPKTPKDFWADYVGEETPLAFMGRFDSNNPWRCAEKYVRRLPSFYGIVRQRTWRATFSQPDQLGCEQVIAGLAAHIEDTREDWEPHVAAYREARAAEARRLAEERAAAEAERAANEKAIADAQAALAAKRAAEAATAQAAEPHAVSGEDTQLAGDGTEGESASGEGAV